jgi:hypothetical protein
MALDGCKWSSSRAGRFTPKESVPRYRLERRLGGPQSRSGHGGEKKNSQPLSGLEAPNIKPVTQGYNTDLSGSYRFRLAGFIPSHSNIQVSSPGLPNDYDIVKPGNELQTERDVSKLKVEVNVSLNLINYHAMKNYCGEWKYNFTHF